MTPKDINILVTTALFKATVAHTTTLKDEFHANMGKKLEKWFKTGRESVKSMNFHFGKTHEETVDTLAAVAIDVLRELIKSEDPQHFVEYINKYKKE